MLAITDKQNQTELWRHRAQNIPTAILIAELQGRGIPPTTACAADFYRLPGFVLDVHRRLLTWCNQTFGLRQREVDVILCLLAAHPEPLSVFQIASTVWGNGADRQNAATHLCHLNRRVPGLVLNSGLRGPQRAVYWLDVPTVVSDDEGGEL